mmetsp:Transcript_37723/g.100371  ORF Transcript_37723/g.100371 Transcript_37723/m.100371 type:complete len:315 (+) Transcript_37723:745-1689(+)
MVVASTLLAHRLADVILLHLRGGAGGDVGDDVRGVDDPEERIRQHRIDVPRKKVVTHPGLSEGVDQWTDRRVQARDARGSQHGHRATEAVARDPQRTVHTIAMESNHVVTKTGVQAVCCQEEKMHHCGVRHSWHGHKTTLQDLPRELRHGGGPPKGQDNSPGCLVDPEEPEGLVPEAQGVMENLFDLEATVELRGRVVVVGSRGKLHHLVGHILVKLCLRWTRWWTLRRVHELVRTAVGEEAAHRVATLAQRTPVARTTEQRWSAGAAETTGVLCAGCAQCDRERVITITEGWCAVVLEVGEQLTSRRTCYSSN